MSTRHSRQSSRPPPHPPTDVLVAGPSPYPDTPTPHRLPPSRVPPVPSPSFRPETSGAWTDRSTVTVQVLNRHGNPLYIEETRSERSRHLSPCGPSSHSAKGVPDRVSSSTRTLTAPRSLVGTDSRTHWWRGTARGGTHVGRGGGRRTRDRPESLGGPLGRRRKHGDKTDLEYPRGTGAGVVCP